MGENAEETLTFTNITEVDCKVYGKVIEKFDIFFKVRKNVIFERAWFNLRCQGEGESLNSLLLACTV